MQVTWFLVGVAGQACFAARFLLQWIASERQRQSVVPGGFWRFSVAGGVLILLYAIHRRDPVFIVGQASGLCIYARNLVLIRKAQEAS